MKLKVLQLNMFMGRHMSTIIDFLHKENFDVIHLQEVTGPVESFEKVDCYKDLTAALDMDSELIAPMKLRGHDDSYFGNATFYRKDFPLINKNIVWLKPYEEIEKYEGRIIENDPRAVIHIQLQIENNVFNFLNSHLAWSPTSEDTDFKVTQGQIFVDYTRQLEAPFLVSGDFNVDPNSKIVKGFSEFSRNLTVEYNVTNTLNSRTHKAKHLFPPGIAVDFIFVSPDIKVHSFRAIEELDLSDHIGLMTEIEI